MNFIGASSHTSVSAASQRDLHNIAAPAVRTNAELSESKPLRRCAANAMQYVC